MSEWKLFVRDMDNRRVAPIADYKAATLKPVYSDVGTWSVTLHRDSPAVPYFVIPGYGLTAVRDDQIVLNGPANYQKHQVDIQANEITISGFTDEVWLRRRNAHASPTEASSPFAQEFDERSGQASSVIGQYVNYNVCEPWALGPRRVPRFFVTADPLLGSTVSGKARFENLLTTVQTLATAGGVGFRVRQIDQNLWFEIYQPLDLSGVIKFSTGLKNLSAYSYDNTAPEANFVYVGGDGDGAARSFTEAMDEESIASWGRIEGDMVDQRKTTDGIQIEQAGEEALIQHGEHATLDIQPIERDGYRYGIDYNLGDTVAILLDGPVKTPYAESNQIVDSLRSVEINLTPDGGFKVKPMVGTPSRGQLGQLFRVLATLKRRVVGLETRK